MLIQQCAWCKDILRYEPEATELYFQHNEGFTTPAEGVSHGICDPCLENTLNGLHRLTAIVLRMRRIDVYRETVRNGHETRSGYLDKVTAQVKEMRSLLESSLRCHEV
jgi:hypothetical protein